MFKFLIWNPAMITKVSHYIKLLKKKNLKKVQNEKEEKEIYLYFFVIIFFLKRLNSVE